MADHDHVRYTDGSYIVHLERRALTGRPGWAPVRYVMSWRGRAVRGAAAYPYIAPLADETRITADDFELEWELAAD